MVAVMLLDKTASFAAAHDRARMDDPAVRRQRAKVEYIPDAELARLLPQRVAVVDVTLSDGTRLTERVESVRGTPRNPMTRDEIVAKARDLMVPVLGGEQSGRLIDTVLSIGTAADLTALRPLLQRA
jgi:2-methylcitrate dehydratase PrpD